MAESNAELESWIERFRSGNRRALARLITLVDDGHDAGEILSRLGPTEHRSLKVGITGAAGSGKSTTIGGLIGHLRSLGRTVAVLACDPASPFSGGALLGDRVRMDYDPADPGVFLRSFSTRGATGGLSDRAEPILRLVERFGFDVILIETVGAGQDQLAVLGLVDLLVLLITPVAGDSIQWEKAGLLEAADIVAVNKADLPGADLAYAGLKAMLELSTGRDVPVLRMSAQARDGIAEVWAEIEAYRNRGVEHRSLASSRRLFDAARRELAARYRASLRRPGPVAELVAKFGSGQVDAQRAASELLSHLAKTSGS